MDSTTPQVILGDPNTGLNSDNLRQALGKYNIHSHLLSSSANGLLTGVTPGEVIQSVSTCDQPYFPVNTTVTIVSASGVTVSDAPLRSGVVSLQIGSQVFDNVTLTVGQTLIQFSNFDGFVSSTSRRTNASKVITGFIPSATAVTYPVLLRVPYKCFPERLSLQTLSGDLTAELLINTRSVATASVTSSVSFVDFQHTAANSILITPLDDISLRITTPISTPSLHYSLYLLALG
jgi:hypothetical protein